MLRRHFTNVANTGGTEEEIETTFYIESLEDGNTVHFAERTWLGTNSISPYVYYSYNKIDWIKISKGLKVTINANERLYLKGSGRDLQKSSSASSTLRGYPLFWVFKPYNVGGNLKEFINPSSNIRRYGYTYFFVDEFIHDASKLILPELTLAEECYADMFYNCKDLTKAPQLPATTLAEYCYYEMFNGCTSLNHIECLATDISASSCTAYWVDGVSSSGTFVKHPDMTSWPTGVSGIPSGWTVQDYVE